jgi:hypothetical protein
LTALSLEVGTNSCNYTAQANPHPTESASQKVKEVAGISSAEAKGKVSEMAGAAQGKASELSGEAKGKASEVKGKTKGAAAEAKGKI